MYIKPLNDVSRYIVNAGHSVMQYFQGTSIVLCMPKFYLASSFQSGPLAQGIIRLSNAVDLVANSKDPIHRWIAMRAIEAAGNSRYYFLDILTPYVDKWAQSHQDVYVRRMAQKIISDWKDKILTGAEYDQYNSDRIEGQGITNSIDSPALGPRANPLNRKQRRAAAKQAARKARRRPPMAPGG
ncbi:MAG: hypothetical protein AB7H77_04320 [Bdellovibrionales bacterium]